MKDGLYQVVTNYLCAGFVVRSGQVTQCAPILRRKIGYWLTLATWICPVLMLTAAPVKLAWDASTETDVAKYRIYYGSTTNAYTNLCATVIGRLNTNAVVSNLPPWRVYHFAATCVDTAGIESDFSNDVGWTNRGNAPFNFKVVP